MTAPAPYTRETLDRIRKGANAENLGWPQDRYRTICRHHGIEPKGSQRVEADPPPPVQPAKPVVAGETKLPAEARAGRKPRMTTTPAFRAHKEKLLGNEGCEDYCNVRVTKRGRRMLVDQADELGLTMMGMLTLMIETAARQGTCGLIIGIPAGEKTQAEAS